MAGREHVNRGFLSHVWRAYELPKRSRHLKRTNLRVPETPSLSCLGGVLVWADFYSATNLI